MGPRQLLQDTGSSQKRSGLKSTNISYFPLCAGYKSNTHTKGIVASARPARTAPHREYSRFLTYIWSSLAIAAGLAGRERDISAAILQPHDGISDDHRCQRRILLRLEEQEVDDTPLR